MHGAEARWNIDLLLNNEVNAMSANEHAASVSARLSEAYRLTCENLGTAAAYSKAWYDKHASGCVYVEGEKVRVLDSRGYCQRTPKWQLRFNQVGQVIRKLNAVTYVVYIPGWQGEKILHMDKLRNLEATTPAMERPSTERPLEREGEHGEHSAESSSTAASALPRLAEKLVTAEGVQPMLPSDTQHRSMQPSLRKTRERKPPKRYSPMP